VARLDLSVYHKMALAQGTEPDLMVTFALPDEAAVMGDQEFLELRVKDDPIQEAKRTRSWRWLVSSNSMAWDCPLRRS